MKRTALALSLLLGCACGIDDKLDVQVVFPDTQSAAAAKTLVFQVKHFNPSLASCANPPSNAPDYKETVTLPAQAVATRSALPTGPVLFLATALDASSTPVVNGCTEANLTNGDKIHIDIKLQY